MKKLVLAAIASVSATMAQAGSVSYQSTAAHGAMAEAAPMGGAVEWLLPLIGLAIIALIVGGASTPAAPANPPANGNCNLC